MKGWIKGGLFGAGISFMINALFLILINMGVSLPFYFFIEYPIKLMTLIFNLGDVLSGYQVYIASFVWNTLFYFIVGTIVGFIVQKIKKRRS